MKKKKNFLRLSFIGLPVAQARPRARVTQNNVHLYSSQKKEYEKIHKSLIQQLPNDWVVIEEYKNISLRLEAYFRKPVLLAKYKPEAENMPRVKKPDLTNVVKFYEDALTRYVWEDDRCVTKVYATKCYSDHPRVEFGS